VSGFYALSRLPRQASSGYTSPAPNVHHLRDALEGVPNLAHHTPRGEPPLACPSCCGASCPTSGRRLRQSAHPPLLHLFERPRRRKMAGELGGQLTPLRPHFEEPPGQEIARRRGPRGALQPPLGDGMPHDRGRTGPQRRHGLASKRCQAGRSAGKKVVGCLLQCAIRPLWPEALSSSRAPRACGTLVTTKRRVSPWALPAPGQTRRRGACQRPA
jgi:hypothetical protein